MKVVTIKQLKNGWSLSFGATPAKRKDAETVLQRMERRLSVRGLKEKTGVIVKYDLGCNESLESKNTSYLLWTAACFLEDHISRASLLAKEKRYGRSEA